MARPLTIALGIAALAALTGCTPKTTTEIDWEVFNGRRAFSHIETIVGYGPRPTASSELIHSATYISTQLQECGLDAEEQVFIARTPRGPLQFRNVIGRPRARRGASEHIIVVATHYDTKYLPKSRFVGANDGGSGVGVLLEMARIASAMPNLWYVFLDGEECVNEYRENDGLWGSTYFVQDLKGRKQLDRIQAMILLDMVGDKDLNIVMPANSNRALVQRVFDAAKATGHRDHFSFGEMATVDDHIPFLNAGIPAVDIIDFQFGSAPGLNDYWHTEKDTLDKISPRSLEIVGQTTLRLVDSLRKNPKLDY
jgi:Zn-dependent M28 family amino/carboxypeptidase